MREPEPRHLPSGARGFWLAGVAPAVLVLVSACGLFEDETLFKPQRVSTQQEAGSTHFAVLSVAPWLDYVEAMQPRFELSEEKALQAVVPATRHMEEKVFDAFRAAIAIKHSEAEGAAGKTGAEGRTAKEQEPSPPPGGAPSTVFPGDASRAQSAPRSQPTGPEIDPMTLYWAATAFYQEVQLLNRYISDAALRHGFDPYVVRLQVSLMPSARNRPYDAYVTLSFFMSGEAAPVPVPGPPEGAGPEIETGLGREGLVREPSGAEAPRTPIAAKQPEGVESAGKTPGPTGGRTPQIIPLMVTDNLEATTHSRMLDSIRQYAAAFSFLSGAFGGAADVQRFTENLQSVLGRDLNSLLTVARVSDNTLRVRLGAMQQAAANFAMVPRTHSITVLLMVPAGTSPTVEVVAKTTMVDAELGQALPDRPAGDLEARLQWILERYELSGVSPAALKRLVSLVQVNNQALFFQELRSVLGDASRSFEYEKAIWVDLASLMVGSQYGATTFDLPGRGPPADRAAAFPSQLALVHDDGEQSTTTLIRDGRERRPRGLMGLLETHDSDRKVSIASQKIEVLDGGQAVRLVFPSLAAWGLAQPEKPPRDIVLRLTHDGLVTDFPVLYRFRAPPAPEPLGTAPETHPPGK